MIRLYVLESDESVFFQVLKKDAETFIEGLDSLTEFILQLEADFFNRVFPIAEIPYERANLVELDLEVGIFQPRQ